MMSDEPTARDALRIEQRYRDAAEQWRAVFDNGSLSGEELDLTVDTLARGFARFEASLTEPKQTEPAPLTELQRLGQEFDADEPGWPNDAEFKFGDKVTTPRAPHWAGTIFGLYRNSEGRLGYNVEADAIPLAIHNYPATGLRAIHSKEG